jgi:hypothetical protein
MVAAADPDLRTAASQRLAGADRWQKDEVIFTQPFTFFRILCKEGKVW